MSSDAKVVRNKGAKKIKGPAKAKLKADKQKKQADVEVLYDPPGGGAKQKTESKMDLGDDSSWGKSDDDADVQVSHEDAEKDPEWIKQQKAWEGKYTKASAYLMLRDPSKIRSKDAKAPPTNSKEVKCVIHGDSADQQSLLVREFHENPGVSPFITLCNEEVARKQLFSSEQYRWLEKYFTTLVKNKAILQLSTLITDFSWSLQYVQNGLPEQVRVHSWLLKNTQVYLLVYISHNGLTFKYRYAFCKCPVHV